MNPLVSAPVTPSDLCQLPVQPLALFSGHLLINPGYENLGLRSLLSPSHLF